MQVYLRGQYLLNLQSKNLLFSQRADNRQKIQLIPSSSSSVNFVANTATQINVSIPPVVEEITIKDTTAQNQIPIIENFESSNGAIVAEPFEVILVCLVECDAVIESNMDFEYLRVGDYQKFNFKIL